MLRLARWRPRCGCARRRRRLSGSKWLGIDGSPTPPDRKDVLSIVKRRLRQDTAQNVRVECVLGPSFAIPISENCLESLVTVDATVRLVFDAHAYAGHWGEILHRWTRSETLPIGLDALAQVCERGFLIETRLRLCAKNLTHQRGVMRLLSALTRGGAADLELAAADLSGPEVCHAAAALSLSLVEMLRDEYLNPWLVAPLAAALRALRGRGPVGGDLTHLGWRS